MGRGCLEVETVAQQRSRLRDNSKVARGASDRYTQFHAIPFITSDYSTGKEARERHAGVGMYRVGRRQHGYFLSRARGAGLGNSKTLSGRLGLRETDSVNISKVFWPRDSRRTY